MTLTATDRISPEARALGEFLRAHREHTPPERVGLPTTSRRRTPGLRREEVATVAGVGVAWYTWLEQGRVSASRQVLASIGRALQLSDGAFDYLLSLGGYATPATPPRTEADAAALAFIVEDWQHGPAFAVDGWFDLLAWNRAFTGLWGDPLGLPVDERNLVLLLADPRRSEALLGAERLDVLRRHLGHFRSQTAVHQGHPRLRRLYATLHEVAPDLADWWVCQSMDVLTDHDVTYRVGGDSATAWQSALRLGGGELVVLQRGRTPRDRALLTGRATGGPRDVVPYRDRIRTAPQLVEAS
ncbi:helix-turn-helix domain-containing protein [Agromyces sp. MMS24-K17]|uniref:helix-turn-helix domain-containing protein n=1 Tax=Agromyces sp. MMS24-K17 TaxID=3372850 RepID=UPI003754A1E0